MASRVALVRPFFLMPINTDTFFRSCTKPLSTQPVLFGVILSSYPQRHVYDVCTATAMRIVYTR